MNVVTRGIRNALRSPVRSGAIIIMLAISIGLIVAMLVARASVNTKIDEVKSSTATTVTISPAGIRGGMGGGDPLTAEQIGTITNTAHIKSTVSTLTDQLGTDDTNLTPSLELGSFGQRQQRFERGSNSSGTMPQPPTDEGQSGASTGTQRTMPTSRTSITGTTEPNSAAANGSALTITSGAMIDGKGDTTTALVGKSLAEKNSLSPGSTFTAYGKTFTVSGIYDAGNVFENNGLIIPLATLQNLTEQAGAVTSVIAIVDSSDNVATTVSTLKTSLGDKADVTSQQEQAASSVSSLQSISTLATTGVIGATVAAAAIVLLTMTMIVRERRREIGVIKAIGGTNTKVIGQFITEAITLTVLGGIIGLTFGVLASGSITQSLVSNQTTNNTNSQQRGMGGPSGVIRGGARAVQENVRSVSATVKPETFFGAIGITILIAIIGSAVPAWLIARVRPAEVLRTE
ncbi:FtsX-like permease family protein [Candidatus Saccharibacteria bacterium]|nr:FtsX-like permease family protein [Candidatus Saccharibacteria bacterium]MBH1972735.1 FtsX-like permease family protein [Candidatus Saccharibacteria bacterium]MBH1990937.1 FtsX-like permease family protein [Candidatus Saccharibacteria bacterium]